MGWKRGGGLRRRSVHDRDVHRVEPDVPTPRKGRIGRSLVVRAEWGIQRFSRPSLVGRRNIDLRRRRWHRMLAGLDPRLRSAVGEILMGFALMNFGVVVAILAYVPSISNPGPVAVALVAALLGLIFAVRGGNEFRK